MICFDLYCFILTPHKTFISKRFIIKDIVREISSAWSPVPLHRWLTSCSLVWLNVFSLICKLVVSVSRIVQNVQMPSIQEVTVFWVTKINDSALFRGSLWIGDQHTLITILTVFHSTHSIQGHEAVSHSFGFVIPSVTCVDIVAEVSSESVGLLRRGIWMAGDSLVTNIGVRCIEANDFEAEGWKSK